MIGIYTIRQDGKIISRSKNVITSEGKKIILRSFVHNDAMGNYLAVGAGNATPTVSDDRLQFMTGSCDIKVVGSDSINNRLIFKGTLPVNLYTKVYEIGMFYNAITDSIPVSNFEDSGMWTNTPTFDNTNGRISEQCLVLNPTANNTKTSASTVTTQDFSQFSDTDQFSLAYYVTNANTASVRIKFGTDSSNYYQYIVTNPTQGYKFSTFTKLDTTVVGAPMWSNIKYIEVATTSKAGGASAVQFDGFRLDDIDSLSHGVILVSRSILATPKTKFSNKEMELEYAIEMGI